MKRVFLMLFCGVLGIFVTGAAVPSQTQIPREELVKALRFLNTEEYAYHSENGRFAPREEMVTFLRKKSSSTPSPLDLGNPKLYELAITTSPDGMHYQITLGRPMDMDDKNTWCETAAFSDERGVIFLGVALGCEAVANGVRVPPSH